MFQSTHPHGVRLQFVVYYIVICIVSIHAPTRGATPPLDALTELDAFQSTHPHGVRLVLSTNNAKSHPFQSTHPHGVRLPLPLTRPPLSECFNPRTHTGCDLEKPLAYWSFQSFNPRTHTGCDALSEPSHEKENVSIHAPTRGATVRLLY